jgi:hypothetical protein
MLFIFRKPRVLTGWLGLTQAGTKWLEAARNDSNRLELTQAGSSRLDPARRKNK